MISLAVIVFLLLHHDDAVEVYINGALASKSAKFTTDYVEVRVREDARKVLKPGKNTLAVHCQQDGGGQYIDVGIVEVQP